VDRLQIVWKDKYVAGMWRGCMIDHLLWGCVNPDQRTEGLYLAPSWSWLSVETQIYTMYVSRNDAEVLECSVEPVDPSSPLGKVSSGFLTVNAAYVSSLDKSKDQTQRWFDRPMRRVSLGSSSGAVYLKLGFEIPLPPPEPPKVDRFVLGLIISPVAGGRFKRTGLFRTESDSRWENADRKAFTLI